MHATESHKDGISDGSRENNTTDQREMEGWKQLEEQLYRRWELLGVCYVKIGDRKVRVIRGLDLLWFDTSRRTHIPHSSSASKRSRIMLLVLWVKLGG